MIHAVQRTQALLTCVAKSHASMFGAAGDDSKIKISWVTLLATAGTPNPYLITIGIFCSKALEPPNQQGLGPRRLDSVTRSRHRHHHNQQQQQQQGQPRSTRGRQEGRLHRTHCHRPPRPQPCTHTPGTLGSPDSVSLFVPEQRSWTEAPRTLNTPTGIRLPA